ncbi:MAG: FAD:protein FMN transferase [Oscillospiraceae bacterium]|nr:FAD:protein FMN transferase [Oscillospiraceae bacterium]
MIVRKISCIILLVVILGVSAADAGGCSLSGHYGKYEADFADLFDTVTTIVGYAKGKAEFDRYANIIYDRMKELDQLYDIYNAYDGINNLYTVNQNAGVAPVKVDRDIIDLLLFAKNGYDLTGGVINIAMGSVLSIWHSYREAGIADEESAELPPMDMLEQAAKLTDINDLIVDDVNNTVFLRKSGMSLDVGAVAKGYAAGEAAKAAKSAGLISALIDAGGQVVSIGKPMDNVRERWGVGIQNPDLSVDGVQNISDTIYVNDNVISCSGDYQRFYIVNGETYCHIIDRATLMPARLYKQVVIICPDSVTADLLSTALFIMPYEEGAALAAKMGAEVLWQFADGTQKATEGYIRISKNLGNYSSTDSTD